MNNNSSLTYEIDTGNFSYEPINNISKNNYYYPSNTEINHTQKNIYIPNNNNHFNSNALNYLNTLNNNFRNNYKSNYYNLYNSYNNSYNNKLNKFSKENINFNKNLNSKIKLTYEYKNISPIEITNKTKELINLQSQMCSINNKKKFNKKRSKSQNTQHSKTITYTKKFRTNKNFKNFNKSFLGGPFGINKKNSFKNKKNKTFNYSLSNKKFGPTNFDSRINMNRGSSLMVNRNNIWKNKYLKVNEEVKNIKNKIKEIKNNNKEIEKRLNYIKEKENNNDSLYDNNIQYKNYNEILVEKYKLSEIIRKKQIDLIIKMQKEVNNMKEKFKILENINSI